MEKNYNKFDDLRFNLTEDMNSMFFEILTIRQMLKNNKLKVEEKSLLENQLKNLTELFIKDFRKNNKEQINIYKEIIDK